MTPDEIKEMFLANATIKHCNPIDPKVRGLEDKLDAMSRKYMAKYLGEVSPVDASKNNAASIQEAVNILATTCQAATLLELEHHPGGLTDEQIDTIALARKDALSRIVEEIVSKN